MNQVENDQHVDAIQRPIFFFLLKLMMLAKEGGKRNNDAERNEQKYSFSVFFIIPFLFFSSFEPHTQIKVQIARQTRASFSFPSSLLLQTFIVLAVCVPHHHRHHYSLSLLYQGKDGSRFMVHGSEKSHS